MNKMKELKVVDFFCGAGGFSEGFRQAGFTVIKAFDIWEPAIVTHNENHFYPDHPEYKAEKMNVIDIANIEDDEEFHRIVPDSEVIIGSPPCVAFSNSNKSGKADKSLGLLLLESYLKIIIRKKMKNGSILKYWLLENVPNLNKYVEDEYSARAFDIDSDYILKIPNKKIYNSKDFDVAQNRKRFICGEYIEPSPSTKDDAKPLKHILNGLGIPMENLHLNVQDPNFVGNEMKSADLTDHHYIKKLAEFEWKKAEIAKRDKGYMGRMAFPENIDKPSRTIMATLSYSSRESIIYKLENEQDGYRVPTIREVASIMSFPIDYKFYGNSMANKYKLVGNAVPPKLSYAFAAAIAEGEKDFKLNKTYKKILHKNEADFKNLNEEGNMPKNVEKPKGEKAKYKYHIPYLIEKAYRVELTNLHSDFENMVYRWDVEVHKSSGENAKVYFLDPNIDLLKEANAELIDKFDIWFSDIKSNLVTHNKFQEFYRMTSTGRKKLGLIGPDELLTKVKEFLVTNNIENDPVDTNAKLLKKDGTLTLDVVNIPFNILFGYYMLENVMNYMSDQKVCDEELVIQS
jgi:DNA (cytosine-5)-methyltransferase 1